MDRWVADHIRSAPGLTEEMIRRWQRKGIDESELAMLETNAPVARWAWDALNALAPDRVGCPRPTGGKGPDPTSNAVRNMRIAFAVEQMQKDGLSFRRACAKVGGAIHKSRNAVESAVRAIRRR